MDGCLNTGLVRTTSTTGTEEAAGGICGIVRDSYIDDCHNAGLIQADGLSTYAGGLIGYLTCSYNSIDGMTEPIFVKNCYNAGQVQGRERTIHAGVFGDEFTMEQFEEKPSDTAFTNVYSDNQATGLKDTRFGQNTDFFLGKLPQGFSSSVWDTNTGAYPTLKAFAALTDNDVAKSAAVFAAGESTRVMKHNAMLQAAQGIAWQLLDAKGNLTAATQGLSISGNSLAVGSAYANDTLVATINGKATGRRLIINVVPKLFDGEGTAASPYLIKNKADFMILHTAVMHYDHEGDFFRQTADVDFGLADDFAGVGAGNHLLEFAGVFDGDNHLIKNLKITAAKVNAQGNLLQGTYNYGGLFHIGSPTSIIRNVIIDASCQLDFYGSAGAVIGYTTGKVENCRNYAAIRTGYNRIGGIAGQTDAGSLIDSCINRGTVGQNKNTTGTTWTGQQYVGGIAAWHSGTASHCRNEGSVVARQQAGGITGRLGKTGQILDCENVADITLPNGGNLGGMAPSTQGSGLSYILRCKNSGNLRGKSYTAGIMTAQVQLSELPGRVITPQKVNLTEAPAKQRTANYTFQELQSAQQTPQQTSVSEAVSQRIPSTNVTALGAPQREVFRANLTAKDKFTTPIRKEAPKGAVPENIIGKSYNTFYGSFTNYNNCVGWLTVEKGQGDTVILKGFADGYDVKGVYNKTAGTVTCPASQVVGTHASLGTVTFYALRGGSYYKNEPVVLTFTDNNITFSAGVYCAVTNGGVVMMKDDLTAIESNGRLKLDRTNQAGAVSASFDLPLYISNVSDIHMDIQGLQSWLYGHNYKVPFTISGNKATLLTTDSLDWYNSTSGTQCYFMLGFNGTNITPDPTFTIAKTDSLTTLTADTRLFCGYNESGNSWRGFFLKDYAFNYKVEQGGGGEMQDTVTVNNIEYALDHSKKEATVLGCAASLTKLDMPGTINANNTDYTVVAVAEQAFYGNSKLTSASLPKTLKVLGKDAFRNVRNLNELKIEDLAAWCNVWMANGNANPIYNVFNSIQSKWGKVYFNGTQVSTSLEIPASVNRIGRSFYGFKTLTSVTLPTGLKVLGDQSFANCINLPTVEIPSTVDSIGSAFWGCEKINNIVIPNGVVTLGASTFYGCKALTDVKLNEGLKTIGSMTFTSCTALTEIELPTTLTDIAGTAFMSSKNITSVKCKAVVPPTTTDNAFADFAATATLYVLEESIPAYKAALGWKNFSSIKKLDKSVNGIDADNDAPAYYYDLNGFRVEQENLTPGIYVKVQGSKTTKVVIK